MIDNRRGYERAIIGMMIMSRSAIDKASEIISADDFYYPEYRAIYHAIEYCIKEHDKIDQLLLVGSLDTMKALDNVGGEESIQEIITETNSPGMIEIFCHKLKDFSVRHKTKVLIEQHMKSIDDIASPIDDTIAMITDGINSALNEKKTRTYANITELTHMAYDETVKRFNNRGKAFGVQTGYVEIDRLLGGLQGGDVIVLAGKTSDGKTSLGLNIMANAAKNDCPVAMFSLEMSKLQLAMRLLSTESRYNTFEAHHIGTAEPTWEKLSDACERLNDCGIFVDDTPGLSLPRFGAKLRQLVREQNIKLCIVDYMQLMEGTNKESRQIEVTSISRGLKKYSMMFNIPIIALSQFSRKADNEDRPPKMSDLRGSGAIEQDASVVLLLHRPSYTMLTDNGLAIDQGDENNFRYVIVGKNRNGPTGYILLHWIGEYMKFDNMARD